MSVLPFDPTRRPTPTAGLRAVRPAARGERPVLDRSAFERPTADRPVSRRLSVEPGPAGATSAAGTVAPVAMASTVMASAAVAAVRPALATDRQAAVALAPAPDERALARWFFPLALLVAAVDLASKWFVVAGLAPGETVGGGRLALHLVYNGLSAGGVSLGEHTRAINFAATGVMIGLLVMLVPTLARLDRRAPTALALLVGGALGNLVSMAISSPGVPDFLAIRHADGAWILNGADVAIAAGLVMLARTVWLLARLIGAHGAGRPVRALGRLA